MPIRPLRADPVRLLFVVLLWLNAAIEVVVGFAMLWDFPAALELGFEADYAPELAKVGIALGCNVLFAGTALGLSAVWSAAGKRPGVILGIAASLLYVGFGSLAFAQLGDVSPLFVDSLRGAVTAGFGIFVLVRPAVPAA